MDHDMLEPIVRVLVTHCKPGVQLGRASAIRGSVHVDGRDAATNPGDNRQGWLTGGVRLAVNGPAPARARSRPGRHRSSRRGPRTQGVARRARCTGWTRCAHGGASPIPPQARLPPGRPRAAAARKPGRDSCRASGRSKSRSAGVKTRTGRGSSPLMISGCHRWPLLHDPAAYGLGCVTSPPMSPGHNSMTSTRPSSPAKSRTFRVYNRASCAWAVAAMSRSMTRRLGCLPRSTTAAARRP